MNSFKNVLEEAKNWPMWVKLGDGVVEPIRFQVCSQAVAWMYRDKGIWKGYSLHGHRPGPEFTGRKGQVADWCLDVAVNEYIRLEG